MAALGSSLRGFDEDRIDLRVPDILSRKVSNAEEVRVARQSLLIKAGRWRDIDIDRLVNPLRTCDVTALAFFAGRITATGVVPVTFWPDRFPDLVQGMLTPRGPATWQALAHLLPAARLADTQMFSIVDERLSEALPSKLGPQYGARAALRTALVFGQICFPRALQLWVDSAYRVGRRATASVSHTELRALSRLEALPEATRSALKGAASPLEEGAAIRHTDEPVRRAALDGLLHASGDLRRNGNESVLRQYFAARDEDWLVPLAYAAHRAVPEGRPPPVADRLASYDSSRRGILARALSGRLRVSSDALQQLRRADEASDLRHLAKLFYDNYVDEVGAAELNYLLKLHTHWRKAIDMAVSTSPENA
jgi:hypothetical protein